MLREFGKNGLFAVARGATLNGSTFVPVWGGYSRLKITVLYWHSGLTWLGLSLSWAATNCRGREVRRERVDFYGARSADYIQPARG